MSWDGQTERLRSGLAGRGIGFDRNDRENLRETTFHNPRVGRVTVYQRPGQNLTYGFRSVDEALELLAPDMGKARMLYLRAKTHLVWLQDNLVAWDSYDGTCPTLSVEAIASEIRSDGLRDRVDGLRDDVHRRLSLAGEALDDLWSTVCE